MPDWVTSKDRNVLRSLLSMPEAEMKQWSRMWVEHTAALVILYQVSKPESIGADQPLLNR